MRIAFEFFAIDKWDDDDLLVNIDGYDIFRAGSRYTNGNHMCGNEWKDNFLHIDFIFPHKSEDVRIKLMSTIHSRSTIQSWGFSDFYVNVLDENKDC